MQQHRNIARYVWHITEQITWHFPGILNDVKKYHRIRCYVKHISSYKYTLMLQHIKLIWRKIWGLNTIKNYTNNVIESSIKDWYFIAYSNRIACWTVIHTICTVFYQVMSLKIFVIYMINYRFPTDQNKIKTI